MENGGHDKRPRRLAGANIEHAGRHNQQVVLHAVRIVGTATRSEIADITDLTAATVSNITNRLLATRLLQSAGQRRGGRGQPATRLTVNPEGAFAIGINIDRDHLTMVAVDFVGQVRARIGRETAFPMPTDVAAFYRDHVGALLAAAGIAAGAVSGIGVARPDDLGKVQLSGRPADYDRWTTTDVATLFAEPIDVPVVVANDAAAAAIGELQFGLGQQYSSFFYLLVTFGLGGGVVVNSLYDHGLDGRSGEIGFLFVDDGAGGRTQLQNIVSLAGLSRALADAGLDAQNGREPDMADPHVTAAVRNWVDQAAQALVEPLIAVNCLLNPGAVLIGGRLPIKLTEQLAERADALIGVHGRHVPALAPIRVAALAEDSPAVGAALLSFGPLMMPADADAARGVRPAMASGRAR